MNTQTLPISTRARLVSEREVSALVERQEQVRGELEAKGKYLGGNGETEEKANG